MPKTQRAAATLLFTALALLFTIEIALAAPKRPPPDDAREQQRRRLIEESERASRAIPPSPPPTSRPNNGIEQIPIETSKTDGFFKEDHKRPSAEMLRQTGNAPRRVIGGQPPPPPPPPPCPYFNVGSNQPPWKVASLLKVFPDVSWHVCVRDMGMKGLWVGPVHLRRNPYEPWMSVIGQAGLADIFVPYHQTYSRPYDLRFTSQLAPVTAQDIGINGITVRLTNETHDTVVAEVRERGVGWLCKGLSPVTRRSQEFVVWGVSDAGNYDNIIQFSFRDDGAMNFRVGHTGYNSPGFPGSQYPPPQEAHTHNGLWRIDMDLNHYWSNTASWLVHREPSPSNSTFQASDDKIPLNVEGARKWAPRQFTSLLIEDAAANANGNKLGYEFTPVHSGTSRHFYSQEAWTQNDFYVTVYHGNELDWTFSNPIIPINKWKPPDLYLLTYLNGESVNNADLVVWVKSSAHHNPSDEDKSNADIGSVASTGITLTHWSGVNIDPHNLFDANPLGGPDRCDP